MIFSDQLSEKFRFGNLPENPLLYSIISINSFMSYFTIMAPVNLGRKMVVKSPGEKGAYPKKQ